MYKSAKVEDYLLTNREQCNIMAKLSKKQRCESRYRVKNKKSFEKVLTKQKRFDIIIKSSH